MLEVHPDCPPDDGDWHAFLLWLEGLDMRNLRGGLTLAEGPGPNAGQRKNLIAVRGVAEAKTAVLTTSIVARGAITALNWLGYKRIIGLDYANLSGGFDYLAVPAAEREPLIKRLVELKCELMGIEFADLVRDQDLVALAAMPIAKLAGLVKAHSSRRRPDAA